MFALTQELSAISPRSVYGRVKSIRGLLVEVAGPVHIMTIGSRVEIEVANGRQVACEVVGFRDSVALCMPFGPLEGVRMGCKAVAQSGVQSVQPCEAWLGRVVNAMGEPIDGKGPIESGAIAVPLRNTPPPPHLRARVGGPLDLGVRALNNFVTCCRGQRMGIFAGSGVGKSVLMSMLARNTACDVAVIGLIGERGREVQEFIEDDLGADGLARSVIVVATSDEAALARRQAAYLTMSLSEYFRDKGNDVLCMMDSITRFAMAQREIGLSGGEPPTTKGYTPTVFSELPRLLERAGPGTKCGSITGLFTVLVEGDDHNEPIADAVRSILDGHIVMERGIAERGRFPAINVLRSVSRTMPNCVEPQYRDCIRRARETMSTFEDMEELIRLGAYRKGSDPLVDRAIELRPALEAFLSQVKEESTSIGDGYLRLAEIMGDQESEFAELEAEEEATRSVE